MPKQRQTCTECSMRRQKCDRKQPCSRCVKRGEGDRCTREWPKEGYNPKIHRTYPRSEKDDQASPESDHSSPGSAANPTHESEQTRPDPKHVTPSTIASPLSDPASEFARNGQATGTSNKQTLSFITWGNTKLDSFKLPVIDITKDQGCPLGDSTTEWNFSNGFGSVTKGQLVFLQMMLPGQKQIHQLVEYHLNNLLWCHGTIHAPTFRKELAHYSNRPDGLQLTNVDLRWAALLFAIMADTIACAKLHTTSHWGFRKDEKGKLSRQWFKASVACLNLADYMWKHHIYSLQAICTLTLCGHLLGFSNTQTTLLSAAIKIAQSLGLQRLGPEETPSDDPANRDKLIRVETCRRVWFQICAQDWFSIPFSDMYCIQKHHFTTIMPSLYNDETMERLPDNAPSLIAYLVNLQALGHIMAECHDAVLTSSTDLIKYEMVLEYEAKIDAWKNNLPTCIHPDTRYDPSWPKYITWIRRSALICYSHKIMMIHRNFLGRSFTDAAFSSTRQSCITAAINITQETRSALEGDGPLFWIDHAFMVAAGITLCLDIFHRKATDREYGMHRKLVEMSIKILSKYEESMIAVRGIKLLSSLLTEQARTVATKSLDNYNRTKRMREVESEGLITSPTNLPFGQTGANKRPKQKFDVPRFVESLGQSTLFPRPAAGMSSPLTANSGNTDNTNVPGNQVSFDAGQNMGNTYSSQPVFPMQQDPAIMSTDMNNHNHNHNGNHDNNSYYTPSTSLTLPSASASTSTSTPLMPTQASSSTTTNTTNINMNTTTNTNDQIRENSNFNQPYIQPQLQPQTLPQEDPMMVFDPITTNTSTAAMQTWDQYQPMDLSYDTFEQFFPPQTGMSNSFLFEDLLNFDY